MGESGPVAGYHLLRPEHNPIRATPSTSHCAVRFIGAFTGGADPAPVEKAPLFPQRRKWSQAIVDEEMNCGRRGAGDMGGDGHAQD